MHSWLIEYDAKDHKYVVSRKVTKMHLWTFFGSYESIHECLFAIKEFEIGYKKGGTA